MEDVLVVGFIGIFFVCAAFLGMMLAVPLAIMWEQDRYIFEDLPIWLMFILVPLWLLVKIWQGLLEG